MGIVFTLDATSALMRTCLQNTNGMRNFHRKQSQLILHVGTHKTGTTSIQHCLYSSVKPLRDKGISVYLGGSWLSHQKPGHEHAFANAAGLAHAFIRKDLLTPKRALSSGKQEVEKEHLQQFRQFVENDPMPTTVLSSEAFCFLRTSAEEKALKEFLLGIFERVKIILVLRSKPQWQHSFSQQIARLLDDGYYNDLPDSKRPNGEWYFDANSMVSFFRNIGDVQIISYEDALAKDRSIIPEFFRALGHNDVLVSGFDAWLNTSPTTNATGNDGE